MKKTIISMALLLSVSNIMGQVDKAALKLIQKEAKVQMAEAQKINVAITEKLNAKTATEDEVLSECRKGQALIRKAVKSGGIADNKLGEAYKISADLANYANTSILKKAENQEAFEDGMLFNMGQLLSVPFVLLGLYCMFKASPSSEQTGRSSKG